MAIVTMRAYSGSGMAGNPLGDTDATALNLGYVTPAGSSEVLEVYWVNEGDVNFTSPELSVMAHPSADAGAAGDGQDVMALIQSGANLLGSGTAANTTNTSAWTGTAPFGPIPDPFPNTGASITQWKCGIRWKPGGSAVGGTVRKGFRWTGTY